MYIDGFVDDAQSRNILVQRLRHGLQVMILETHMEWIIDADPAPMDVLISGHHPEISTQVLDERSSDGVERNGTMIGVDLGPLISMACFLTHKLPVGSVALVDELIDLVPNGATQPKLEITYESSAPVRTECFIDSIYPGYGNEYAAFGQQTKLRSLVGFQRCLPVRDTAQRIRLIQLFLDDDAMRE